MPPVGFEPTISAGERPVAFIIMAKNNVRQMTVVHCGHSTVGAVAESEVHFSVAMSSPKSEVLLAQ